MTSMIKTRARSLRATVSWAAMACALAAGSTAWAQQAAQTPSAADQTLPPKKNATPTGADQGTSVSEVVVTGTSIRGVQPIAPLQVLTRDDIETSGYPDIGDVMRSLPEDFAAGQNPGVTTNGSNINNQNVTNGSTVDLLGLGSDATLTLINGHRMPGDGFFQAADISVIPLAAIQRVEVVTDGSSAIYGSDAVAGVVNFILRKDYDGLEASAYYGGATDGGGEQQTYSLLGGVVRDNWHVLVSAEYARQDPITASQRAFTSSAYGPYDLIQSQDTRTVFLNGGVNLTKDLSFSLDALYSDRESGGTLGVVHSYYTNEQEDSPNYQIAETFDFNLPRDWALKIIGTESASSTASSDQEYVGTTVYPNAVTYRNDVNSAEVTASGTAVRLPTGNLRLAVGGGYREEGFQLEYPGKPTDLNAIRGSRDVAYAYGEMLVPLVPASPNRLGLQELELSVSGRYEHYSDFGDTTNPKVALRYVPIDGLSIRGSWGTSFKAPSFTQEFGPSDVYAWPIAVLGGSGPGVGLETYGGNPHLKPERSTNWTIGADCTPKSIPSMVLSLTYFNIEYSDRIVQPLVPNFTAALSNSVNAPYVTLDPTAAAVQSALATAPASLFYNFTGAPFNVSNVVAIVANSYQNAVAQADSGVDFSYRQRFSLSFGDVGTFANATWIHQTEQVSAVAPSQTLSGTIYNVPRFKARAGVTWSNYGVTATAIVNYTSSETDTAVTPNHTVSSWTTVDSSVSYKFPDASGIRHGLALTLLANNLLDSAPPYVKSAGVTSGLYYDSLNASPIGRFVAFRVSKKW